MLRLSLCSAFFVFLLISFRQTTQEISPPKISAKTCSFSEVYRKDGWTIPGLKGAKVKARTPLKEIPGVLVAVLAPPGEPDLSITEFRCSRDQQGRLEIVEQPIGIQQLWAFEFGGKTFAYRLFYGKEAIDKGRRWSIGAARDVIFYDLDGSGKFTLCSSFPPIGRVARPRFSGFLRST